MIFLVVLLAASAGLGYQNYLVQKAEKQQQITAQLQAEQAKLENIIIFYSPTEDEQEIPLTVTHIICGPRGANYTIDFSKVQ